MLLRVTSDEKSWNLNLGEIARGWKGGCIIRAKFLDRIRAAFANDATLSSLLLDERYSVCQLSTSLLEGVMELMVVAVVFFSFAKELRGKEAAWRRVVSLAAQEGIAVPALSASLAYFDAYSSAKVSKPILFIRCLHSHRCFAQLPVNLVQAQRDYFGAHTYQRIDREDGPFHTNWSRSSN